LYAPRLKACAWKRNCLCTFFSSCLWESISLIPTYPKQSTKSSSFQITPKSSKKSSQITNPFQATSSSLDSGALALDAFGSYFAISPNIWARSTVSDKTSANPKALLSDSTFFSGTFQPNIVLLQPYFDHLIDTMQAKGNHRSWNRAQRPLPGTKFWHVRCTHVVWRVCGDVMHL